MNINPIPDTEFLAISVLNIDTGRLSQAINDETEKPLWQEPRFIDANVLYLISDSFDVPLLWGTCSGQDVGEIMRLVDFTTKINHRGSDIDIEFIAHMMAADARTVSEYRLIAAPIDDNICPYCQLEKQAEAVSAKWQGKMNSFKDYAYSYLIIDLNQGDVVND